MQVKIDAFFKPSTPKDHDPVLFSDNIDDLTSSKAQEIRVTYTRRTPKPNPSEDDNGCEFGARLKEEVQLIGLDSNLDDQEVGSINSMDSPVKSASLGKILNKKRSYAQYHLELGQSDFLLHTCSVCGLKYARGDEDDEGVHNEFHKNFSLGIQFKGWRNERVISSTLSNGDRIILVLNGDLPSHLRKVEEVVKMMEKELGLCDGWLLHELCKVYLFISRQRIVGCLVAEPIRSAHRVISSSADQLSSDVTTCKKIKSNRTVLQFGSVNFQREVVRKLPSLKTPDMIVADDKGTVLCEKEVVPATCGIRAIWVAPFSRRKRIATQLLDALRKSFCKGYVLESSQCAFSQPTSSGKELASSYCGTGSFLIYMSGTHSC
ncbi:protein CHROMOSOME TRANSMISSION FIDELITY 7 [Magnolia sinica]|uniref:protein CHROMOSOME TRANSMISSION FIDELITY 7 n=1 Tax=Magnolia sinica TaxID=86752 RepID=UPI002658FC13|nr:protein CHROMOSOME TRANSMISSION FIDELITY 7 [Magnolia sinica]XP_058086427.1 protein CHROMOSOME TRANSMISSION FIDELITY 7 [Magnolia sinica]